MNAEKEKERELIINLSKKGKTVRDIAFDLDISKSKADFWINRYKKTKSLADIPKSGRPALINKNQFTKIKKALQDQPPERYGGESIGWTTKMLLQFIKDNFGVDYTIRYAEILMHKCKLSLITPRSEHKSASYAARTVYRMDFKKNLKMSIWVPNSSILTKQASD